MALSAAGYCHADDAGWTPYARGDSFTYSGPVTIHEYLHKWHGPLQSDGNALTYNWAETGVRHGPWSVSYLERYDYEIKASHDSAELYYQVQNKQPLTPGTTYQLDVRAYHQRSWGARLAYQFQPLPTLQVEAGISGLRGKGLLDGRISGTASADAAQSYSFDAQVDYFYSRDYIFKRQVDTPPRSLGMSLDLSLRWNPLPALSLYAQGRDLYGFLHWHPAPFTDAVATSNTKHYDSSGYLTFSPTLSGQIGNGSLWQRLKPHGTVGGDWAFDDRTSAGSELFITDAEVFWKLDLRRSVGGVWLGAQTIPLQHAGGFTVQWRQLQFAMMSDGLNLGDAHLLSMQLGLAWTF